MYRRTPNPERGAVSRVLLRSPLTTGSDPQAAACRRTHLCQTLCTFVLIASTLSSGIAVRISTMRGMSFWRMRTVKEAMSKMLSNGTYSEEQGRNGLV